ncbi:MAG: hypothetical protein KTR31_15410 [Myxococcales bacterium]|nr:hypothetical protein [Myxococcales bacterium]
MSEATALLAAGCLLQIAETELSAEAEGWLERTHLEVAADPVCPRIVLPLPPRSELTKTKARTRLGDGSRSRLADTRWEITPRSVHGDRLAILHLPELVGGDRVVLDLERSFPPGELAWRPGAARYWQVDAGSSVEIRTTGPTSAHERKARQWATGTEADLAAIATSPLHTPLPPIETLGPPGQVDVRRDLQITVPPGDPQIGLFPGAGSTVRVQLELAFAPSTRLRAFPVPAPAGAEVSFSAEPRRVAELLTDTGGPRVRVAPSEGTAHVTVSWVQPDAPTFGERAPHESELTVRVQGGEVAWEGDAWRLVEIRGRPILPHRDGLVKALGSRFRRAALPEPSVPPALRGQPPSWEAAAQLRAQLLQRSPIGDWPTDPVWVRPLVKARRSGALTPTEAAIVLVLYARQLQLQADWVLVRPAWRGKGPEQGLSGYVHPLVRLVLEDQAAWVDPTCDVCGPFELPAHLQGASALSPSVQNTPSPRPGSWHVTVTEAEVRWELTGTAALELRRWLMGLPAAGRTRALAARMAGAGARLGAIEGLAEAGEPVRAVARRGAGLFADPLDLPSPGPAGDVWLDWIGERQVTWLDRPQPAEVTEAELSEGITYRRVAAEEGWSEVLSADRRGLGADHLAQLRELRYGASSSEPSSAEGSSPK